MAIYFHLVLKLSSYIYILHKNVSDSAVGALPLSHNGQTSNLFIFIHSIQSEK